MVVIAIPVPKQIGSGQHHLSLSLSCFIFKATLGYNTRMKSWHTVLSTALLFQ